MSTFSQRIGITASEKALQLRSIDQELRNDIWTYLTLHLWNRYAEDVDHYDREQIFKNQQIHSLVNSLYVKILRQTFDSIPEFQAPAYTESGYRQIRKIILEGPWNKVYDVVDFLGRNAPASVKKSLLSDLNACFERDNAGYRFVEDQIVEITAPAEIQAIEDGLSNPSKAAKKHFIRALELLSDRSNPDYRNSIKESISAVESAAQALAGKPKATLNECLKIIKSKKPLHPTFENALIKLYAWTSDDGGIRHAMQDNTEAVTYADAKFMLVTCSAFTSYLWTVAAEAGIAPK